MSQGSLLRGTPLKLRANPSGTSLTELLAAPTKGLFELDLLVISSKGTGANASLSWNDGTNETYLLYATPITANDSLFVPLYNFRLLSGYNLSIQTDTGSELYFTLDYRLVKDNQ